MLQDWSDRVPPGQPLPLRYKIALTVLVTLQLIGVASALATGWRWLLALFWIG